MIENGDLESDAMRLRQFRIRTLLIAVALVVLLVTVSMHAIPLQRTAAREQMPRTEGERARDWDEQTRALAEAQPLTPTCHPDRSAEAFFCRGNRSAAFAGFTVCRTASTPAVYTEVYNGAWRARFTKCWRRKDQQYKDLNRSGNGASPYRSGTGNAVCGSNCTEGSNPSLSA